MNRAALALLLAFGLLAASPCFGQGPTTGTPPFGSFGGGPFDTINLGNLNVHFSIPVVNKAGRGMPFTYALSYDSSVWAPVTNNGVTSWSPTNNWGWHADTEVATGYVSYSYFSISCNPRLGEYKYTWTGFVYHDPFGTSHNILGYAELDDCSSVNNRNLVGQAVDGSGYTVSFYVDGSGTNQVTSRNGSVITPPYGLSTGAATATDANGNQITADGTGKFFDTLSSTTPVLTVAGTSPKTFTYTGPSGSGVYTMNYGSYNVKTSFGCSGVSEYTGTVPLVSSIVLPDTSKYSFTYEISGGYYTGRLASVTLPTGGTISYTYTGANKGIVCADGSTLGLTRTTPDSSTAWTYSRTGSGTAWVTTVNDPLGDKTVINFSKDSSTTASTNNFYETQRLMYQGASTLLLTTSNCWNNNLSNCATQAVASPITQVDAYLTWPSGSQSHSQKLYDSVSGLMTAEKEYDYTTTILRNTTLTYTNMGSNVGYRPTCVQVTAGTTPSSCGTITSDTVSATTYGNYDANGNVRTVSAWVSGSKWLSRSFTYTTGGLIQTATDVNGAQTTYSYAANNNCPANSFPSSVAEPLSLSRSMTWDCKGGVPHTVTDENLQPTTYSYDSMWRMNDITFPDGGETTTTYNITANPPNIAVNRRIDSSRWLTTQTNLDGLGRVKQNQWTSDPSGTDYVDTAYDGLGRVFSVSQPYRSGASIYSTQYGYDALGRVLTATDAAGNVVGTSYTNRAIQTTYPAAVNKKTINQYDGLGRIVSVCEVGTAEMGSGPASCGLDISGTGYLTAYSYRPGLTQVTTDTTRTFSYDGLGRITAESNPETGTITYTYDGAGINGNNPAQGDLYQRVWNGITTTYTYDLMHRPLQIAYLDGAGHDTSTPWVGFAYDGYDIFNNGNYDLNNGKGRLTSAWTNLNNNGVTIQDAQSTFQYDSMGRAVANWQCVYFPGSTPCGLTNYTEFQYSYDFIGNILSQGNGTANYTNTYNAVGQLANINTNYLSSTESGTLATGFTYNALGEVTYDTLANGLSETFKYDVTGKPNYFNLSNWQYSYGTNGSYPNTWVGPYLTASGDSDNGNWNYTYDSLGLLSGAACLGPVCPSTNAAVTYGYKYDRYGNRWQQNVISGTGTWNLLTFNSSNQVTSNTYDGFGNVTSDGSHNYTYDYANRVIGVDGNSTESNTYDAFGRLASRTNSSGTYEYLYDLGGNRVSTLTSAGAVVQPEIYIGGRHWGSIISNSTVFMHTDWLGTGRVWTSLSGGTYKACQSLPFGDGQSCQLSSPATEFAALLFDPSTNLWNAEFRNQSPTQGHWMSPDPAGLAAVDPTNPQTWNRYAYVMNNPVSNIDPLGLVCMVDSCDGEGGGSGGSGDPFGPGGPSGPPSGPCDPIAFPGTCNPGPIVPPGARGSDGGGKQPTCGVVPLRDCASAKNAMAMPPPGSAQNCEEQLNEMLNDIQAVRGASGGFKGLAQRFGQILSGSYADPGHIVQFQQRQSNLQTKIDNYRDSGCGEPPPLVTQWANMPVASPWALPSLQNFSVPSWVGPTVVGTGAVACAVFVPGCLEVELGTAAF
jgi:RHS repeat-associated protein